MKALKLIVLYLLSFLLIAPSCNQNTSDAMHDNGHRQNRLAKETSPYLLQHQYNPVDWFPWGDEAFEKAKAENKLVLISIGYSACHWCHVMERESFEDDSVAKIMNERFVSIKVDREERPDVDQVYMNAVQLMGQNGGWPLNCFVTPEGKPFMGGTYYPKEQWTNMLAQLDSLWLNEPDKIIEYADKLTEGVQSSEAIIKNTAEANFETSTLNVMVDAWQNSFDRKEGGPNRQPKFPMPSNYNFLLKYAITSGDADLKDYVKTTLDKMALGGIYDQIGGGFARYSTDYSWKVPHFEKMLYDNGQLVSLYAQAYQNFKDPLYKSIVKESLEWVKREMTGPDGEFYSALDADSEGEEGKFYIWDKMELDTLLGEDFNWFKDFYNVNPKGKWEGHYILLNDKSPKDFAASKGIELEDFQADLNRVKKLLLAYRENRERPGLDDKTLTSWNALMISGYCDAYRVFGDEEYKNVALKNAQFILNKQVKKDGSLFHSYKKGTSSINGYLEDYANTIVAFLDLYESTFDEVWINEADKLAQYCVQHFYDEESGMFFFTSDTDPELIARKTEVYDNVIPSSNSILAHGLYDLGLILDKAEYGQKALTMLNNLQGDFGNYPSGFSNWAALMMKEVFPYYEICIAGNAAETIMTEFSNEYVPNRLFLADQNGKSKLPLLEFKYAEGETMIFVCVNKACQLPVAEVEEAMKQIKIVQ
ncbi:MAG: thioredoxin domain-containing protein [Bacteroidota bacterium]